MEILLEEATHLLIKERLQHKPIFDIIEKYISSESLILGGVKCNYLLVANKSKKEEESEVRSILDKDYLYAPYEIYTSDAETHANKLTELLKKHTKFVILTTTLKNKEYSIEVEFIKGLILFHNLDSIKMQDQEIQIQDRISPVMVHNISSNNMLKVMPPNIQLIDIYHKLYSPNEVDNWPELRKLEERLWNYEITGGKRRNWRNNNKKLHGSRPNFDYKNKHSKHGITSREPLHIYLNKFFKHSSFIWIGKYAMELLTGNTVTGRELEIITDWDDDTKTDPLIRHLEKYFGKNEKILIKKQPIRLIKDFRLVKYRVLIGKRVILTIFNSAKYELLPYKIMDNDIKIGSYLVIMRFMLINAWTNMLFSKPIDDIMDNVDSIRQLMNKTEDNDIKLDYIGQYIDEGIALKKLTLKIKT